MRASLASTPYPKAKAAIESAGMTPREYLVFSFSLFQSGMAAWALSQPGGTLPPGVSKANVDFYRSHEQALKKLAPQQGSDTCGDDEGRGTRRRRTDGIAGPRVSPGSESCFRKFSACCSSP